MNTPGVALAPHLLQKLVCRKQPLSCTTWWQETSARAGPPEKRRHGWCGGISPNDYEIQHKIKTADQQAAA